MGWIPLESTLYRHRKTIALAEIIHRHRLFATGMVVAVWNTATEFEPDGDFSAWTDAQLDTAIGWDGVKIGSKSAMIRAGFMEKSGQLHDWDKSTGSWGAAMRKRAQRVRASCHGTVTGQSRDSHGDVTLTGEDKTRQDKTGQDNCVSGETQGIEVDEVPAEIYEKDAETKAVTVSQWPYPVVAKSEAPSLCKIADKVRVEPFRHADWGRDMKAGKILATLLAQAKVSEDEFAMMLKYHETVVFPGGGGYSQTWVGFCAKADQILGEIRRGKTVDTKQIASARKGADIIEQSKRIEDQKRGK